MLHLAHRMEGVFQTVGENGAQLRIGYAERLRQPGTDVQPNLHPGGLVRKGRADQIHRLIFAEPPHGDGHHILPSLADIGEGLLRLSGIQKAVDHVQVVTHIVAINRRLIEEFHDEAGAHQRQNAAPDANPEKETGTGLFLKFSMILRHRRLLMLQGRQSLPPLR